MSEVVDRLAAVADELRVRVRECPPAEVHQWLIENVAGLNEWVGLAMLLSVAVPDGPSWTELTGWFAPRPDPSFVDEIAVERACKGEPVTLTRAERNAVIERLARQGASIRRTAAAAGVSVRTVERQRATLRLALA